MKKILIAGGTGFIGYWLAKECIKKKYKVFSLSLQRPKEIRYLKKVKYITCDVTNKKKLLKKIPKKIDYVVNLSGHVNHKEKKKSFNSHFLGCKNLADIYENINIKKFVQIGSSVEYNDAISPHTENIQPTRPVYGYNLGKYLATNYLIEKYNKRKFPVIILRLYQTFGPKQDINRLIPIIIQSCIKGIKFPCSSGNQYKDFIYIKDLIRVIIKVLKSSKNGEIFNVGTGKPINVKYIITYIKNKIKKGKPDFGKIKLRKDEQKYMYPSISKLKKFFNWKPKISFLKGLNITINYYLNEKKK